MDLPPTIQLQRILRVCTGGRVVYQSAAQRPTSRRFEVPSRLVSRAFLMGEPVTSVSKARSLIDSRELSLACLLLRQDIERYVYRTLQSYSIRYDKNLLLKHWQPSKAIRLLHQLEPRSKDSFKIGIAQNSGKDITELEFTEFGHHEVLTYQWINKHYNKLSSYIHLDSKSGNVIEPDSDYLHAICNEILKAFSGNVRTFYGESLSFDCTLCNGRVTCCVEALPDLDEVWCTNDRCRAVYKPSYENGDWYFELKTMHFRCPECEGTGALPTDTLNIGDRISCNHCETLYVVAGNEWKLYRVKN